MKGQITMNSKKILVIEDDPEMRLALRIRLEANNYEVVFAVDGVSGVAEARTQAPDLILLDIGLPAGDGFVLLERLRSIQALTHIPVVVVSGRDRAANLERAHMVGARAFLQKPVKNSELLLTIDRFLKAKRPSPSVVYEIGPAATVV